MKKQYLLRRMGVMMVVAASLPLGAYASETVVGGIYYNFDEGSQTAEVTFKGKTRYTAGAYQGEVAIPESVSYEGKTYRVVAIGDHAFAATPRLHKVTVPSSVETIGYNAFVGSGVESVVFAKPSGVKSIARQAFLACRKLKAIEIPQSVETIGKFAFEMCSVLEDVSFAEPSKLSKIEDYVFCRTGLKSIAVPASVSEISDVAFCENAGITEVVLPKNVTKVSARNPFCYNPQVTSMSVEEGNAAYDSREGCNGIIETATNTIIAGCKTTKIPSSVTRIGRSAFNNCRDMASIQLPGGVTSVGKYSFYTCPALTSFTFPSTLSEMADSAFWKTTGLDSVVSYVQKPFDIDESNFEPSTYTKATLYVPAGTKSLYRGAKGWRNFATIEEMDVFVAGGISYAVLADGTAEVVAPLELTPYGPSLVVPAKVVSGEKEYVVSGVSAEAVEGGVEFLSVPSSVSTEGLVASGNRAATVGGGLQVVVRDEAVETVSVYGGKGVIRIVGSDAEAQVLNLSGVVLKRSTKRSIPMAQGIYLVKVGSPDAVKVVVE